MTMIGLGSGCGSSSSPTAPIGSPTCTFTVTISSFPQTPVPTQGTRYGFFFANNILPSTAAVYLVDVNAAPIGCTTPWTAVSGSTSAVQLSPAFGSGAGQVELFIPANTGAQRSTDVTIAGEKATIVQAGR
jgi:hypothetical protein